MRPGDASGGRPHWRSGRRGDPFESFFLFGPRAAASGLRLGRRKRRGDMRYAILETLAERPSHGYDVIRALEQQERGHYRPSAGSVYPTLQLLEDGGFVTSAQSGGKRVYTITALGRTELAQRPHTQTGSDAEENADALSSVARAVRTMRGLGEALHQAISSGDAQRIEKILDIVARARKESYEILGEDEGDG